MKHYDCNINGGENMEKIIAKEVNPALIDFSYYFDDDGLKSVGGENCAVYIVPADSRRYGGFNLEEYREIEEKAEAIIDGFHNVGDKYVNYKEVMEYNGIPYTSRKCHLSEERITEIGKFWLGCGTEFCIDDCSGFYVPDNIRWEEGETLRKYLADLYGCKPEELEIYLYDGEHIVTDYKLME